MAKAVFTTKVSPTYDDLPEVRYHFPKTYLRQVEAAVGDWIVYYEPRRSSGDLSSRGGRLAYFAIAKVLRIDVDQRLTDHYYAYVDDYLDFDRAVPFRSGDHYYESSLRRDDGGTSRGAFGRAVRIVPDDEFELILAAGFALEASKLGSSQSNDGGFAELQVPFEEPRPRIELTLTRPFRDEAFRRQVRAVYDNRCAVTGLKLINGGGRPEVQAAHIRPVASSGPDSVRNGIALTGTMHWMFDRGLISVDDEFRIIASSTLPEDAARLIRKEGVLILPVDPTAWPHRSFLRFHREGVFKG